MKYAKAHSLRTQQAVGRFGKSAAHPVCLAALDLWRLEEELARLANEGALLEEDIKNTEQLREQLQALIEQFRREQKENAAKEASALLRKIDDWLSKARKCHQAQVKLFWIYEKLNRVAVARFINKCDDAVRAGDAQAHRALQRVRQRWNGKKAFLGDRDRRALEILKMLRDKVIKAAIAKGKAIGGYMEAAFGGDRLLSDEAWQGRFTARDIQSRLVDAPGDKDGKEVRRTTRKLGISLAADQRGRKEKSPYLKKQEPKKPRGRPRENPELVCVEDIEAVHASLKKPPRVVKVDSWTKTEKVIAGITRTTTGKAIAKLDHGWSESVRKDLAAIDKEIRDLCSRNGHPVERQATWKAEGQTKGRSAFFSEWIDSLADIVRVPRRPLIYP